MFAKIWLIAGGREIDISSKHVAGVPRQLLRSESPHQIHTNDTEADEQRHQRERDKRELDQRSTLLGRPWDSHSFYGDDTTHGGVLDGSITSAA